MEETSFNSKAFSIFEILITLSLISIIAISTLSILELNLKNQKIIDAKSQRSFLLKKSEELIRNPKALENTLNGQTGAIASRFQTYRTSGVGSGPNGVPSSRIATFADSYENRWDKGYDVDFKDTGDNILIPALRGRFYDQSGNALSIATGHNDPKRFWKINARWFAIGNKDYGYIIRISKAVSPTADKMMALKSKFVDTMQVNSYVRSLGKCPDGEYFEGVNSQGKSVCRLLARNLVSFNCPSGQSMTGFDSNSRPICTKISGAGSGGSGNPRCKSRPYSSGTRFECTCADHSGGCCVRWSCIDQGK